MNADFNELERLLKEANKNDAAIDSFYERVWSIGGQISSDSSGLLEKMEALIKSKFPVRSKYRAISTFAFGMDMFFKVQLDASLHALAEAKKMFSELGEVDWEKSVEIIIGCNYRTLGEIDLALKYLFDGFQCLQKTSTHKMFLGYCAHNIAGIYSDTGQHDEALKYFYFMEKLAVDMKADHFLTRSWMGIGVVYQCEKKYAQALDYLKRALELSEK